MNTKQIREYVCKYEITLFPKPGQTSDNGYVIARYKLVKATQDLPKDSVFIAKGCYLPVNHNVRITLRGEWKVDPHRQGRSLIVSSFEEKLPETKNAVIAYISSLKVGLGPKCVALMYDKFGEGIWDILDHNPDALMGIRGVTKPRLDKLKVMLDERRVIRKLMTEFKGCEEMTLNRATNIFKKYGVNSLHMIRSNPYELCKIRGFSFAVVDALARTLPNWSATRKERLEAGIISVFQANSTKGHTCIPKQTAVSDLNRILAVGDVDVCRNALNAAHKSSLCRVKGKYCYSRFNYMTEETIAQNVLRMIRETPPRRISDSKLNEYIDQFERDNQFKLADAQRLAVMSCFKDRLCIITGGPGTGKSTIIKAILCVAKLINEDTDAMLMAPTGRAARRMQEATDHPASTIHSALGIRYGGDEGSSTNFGVMTDNEPLDTDFVIVDEVSMIDQHIANCLFSRVGDYSSLILLGDCDQLPSVGAGNVLSELIRAQLVPVHRLNVIFRQQKGNPIIENSAKIRDGKTNLTFASSFKQFDIRNPDETFAFACNFYERCVKQFGIDEVALLIPHRRKGQLCSDRFNAELERRLNPGHPDDPTVKVNGKEFRAGDKVMQTRNTDFAKNGDIGYIVNIAERGSENDPGGKEVFCDISFEGSPILSYTQSDMQDVDLAYAQSIHKSQGQQYRTVIVVMTGEHELMARRNLLYTAVTRAKENVALIGEASVFIKAIESCEAVTRYTQLADFINELDRTVPKGYDPRYYTPNKEQPALNQTAY